MRSRELLQKIIWVRRRVVHLRPSVSLALGSSGWRVVDAQDRDKWSRGHAAQNLGKGWSAMVEGQMEAPAGAY